MGPTIRRIRVGEGDALARLRLATLAGSPEAFSSTWARQSVHPASHWDQMALTGSAGDARATFVAGEFVGMVGGYRPLEDPSGVELVGMYTSPGHRGSGIGAALVGAVVTGAGAIGASRVGLWVVRTNAPTIALYEHAGFADAPAPEGAAGDCRDERRLARPV